MTEHASSAAVASYSEIMHAIYQHVASGTGPLRFASDTGTDALYDGSSFGTPADSSFWDASGSYMVVEGDHPSGDSVWQLKITRTTSITTQCAPAGGWTTSGFSALVGQNTATLDVAPAANDQVWVSSANLDSYNAGTLTYSWLCVLHWDDSNSDFARGFYSGGYVPVLATDDEPYVLLRKVPSYDTYASVWGSAASLNETHSGAGKTALSYACILSANIVDSRPLDFSGHNAVHSILVGAGASNLVGRMGANTMVRVTNGVADRSRDTESTIVTSNGLAIRFNG